MTNWRTILAWQVGPIFEVGARVRLVHRRESLGVREVHVGDTGTIVEPWMDTGRWEVKFDNGATYYSGGHIPFFEKDLELI